MTADDRELVAIFARTLRKARLELPPFAAERVAGRLSTEPPYSRQHPATLVPLARDLLTAAIDALPDLSTGNPQ